MKTGIGTTTITQIGLVVKDMDRAIAAYCDVLGLPQPQVIVTDEFSQAKTQYRGQPTYARAKLAFFNMGQVQIELIEPVGEPSTWKEALDANGYSVHHIAFQVKDTPAVIQHLAEHDIPVIQQGHYTGGMYTYVDSQDKLGVVLELLENFN
jgi:catechol 2,3-dioxygenase-like lactoylglutathione lyase family enzyme